MLKGNLVGGGLSSSPSRGVIASGFFYFLVLECPHNCPRPADYPDKMSFGILTISPGTGFVPILALKLS